MMDKKSGGKKKDVAKDAVQNDKVRSMRYHQMTVEQLEQEFNTVITGDEGGRGKHFGLTPEQAEMVLQKHGPNCLKEKKGTPWYVKLIKELTGPFALMLWFSSILCLIAFLINTADYSNLYLSIILALVVLITSLFSFSQQAKAGKIMAQFKNFIPQKSVVIRAGQEQEVEAIKLVPGDIVKLKGGDNIPADVRILECSEMKVNNASLTGESEDLIRRPEMTSDNPLETKNLAFFGTQCTVGHGVALVFETGERTVIGQIANLASSAGAGSSTLNKEIHIFIKYISYMAFTEAIGFFVLGFIRGYGVLSNFIIAIGVLVANVPEGVVAAVTIQLALTAKQMAKKKVLVKNLESIETLGSTTCICSDKTGTLT